MIENEIPLPPHNDMGTEPGNRGCNRVCTGDCPAAIIFNRVYDVPISGMDRLRPMASMIYEKMTGQIKVGIKCYDVINMHNMNLRLSKWKNV